MIVSTTRSDNITSNVGTHYQSIYSDQSRQLCPPGACPVPFRAVGHDVTGRRSHARHGVARWRGGKKEVAIDMFCARFIYA